MTLELGQWRCFQTRIVGATDTGVGLNYDVKRILINTALWMRLPNPITLIQSWHRERVGK